MIRRRGDDGESVGPIGRNRARKRRPNPAARGFLLTVDALRVDPHEHVHAVPGPLGDLGSRYSGVEP